MISWLSLPAKVEETKMSLNYICMTLNISAESTIHIYSIGLWH